LKEFYKSKNLTNHSRSKILTIIAESFYEGSLKKYKAPNVHEIERLADHVVVIFPTEEKALYFLSRKACGRQNAGRLLYNKIHNLNRKRYISLKRLLSSLESESENESKIELVAKLKFLNGLKPECIELWEETYDFRANSLTKTQII